MVRGRIFAYRVSEKSERLKQKSERVRDIPCADILVEYVSRTIAALGWKKMVRQPFSMRRRA
jgi:hypothetical protein